MRGEGRALFVDDKHTTRQAARVRACMRAGGTNQASEASCLQRYNGYRVCVVSCDPHGLRFPFCAVSRLDCEIANLSQPRSVGAPPLLFLALHVVGVHADGFRAPSPLEAAAFRREPFSNEPA